jgi:hypothetical protein
MYVHVLPFSITVALIGGGSAGTPSDGYKTADDQGHEYAPRIPDPGERETCRCGRERGQHVGVAR